MTRADPRIMASKFRELYVHPNEDGKQTSDIKDVDALLLGRMLNNEEAVIAFEAAGFSIEDQVRLGQDKNWGPIPLGRMYRQKDEVLKWMAAGLAIPGKDKKGLKVANAILLNKDAVAATMEEKYIGPNELVDYLLNHHGDLEKLLGCEEPENSHFNTYVNKLNKENLFDADVLITVGSTRDERSFVERFTPPSSPQTPRGFLR